MSNVIAMVGCPSISLTTFGFTCAESASVAQVWRRCGAGVEADHRQPRGHTHPAWSASFGTLVQMPNYVQALSFGLAATIAIVAVTVPVEVAITVLAVRQARDSRSHAVANTTSATHRAIAHPAGKHHTRASQHGYYEYHSHHYLVTEIRI